VYYNQGDHLTGKSGKLVRGLNKSQGKM